MSEMPLAYFISFTTYGTWLHGRDPGSVDHAHNQLGTPCLPPDESLEQAERGQLTQPPDRLDAGRRTVVLETIREVCRHRGWRLWAVHVRSNHVHVVVTAAVKPEKVMADFKAYASRRLREHFKEASDRKRWTEHGSTRYLWKEDRVHEAIDYVLNRQGTPMAVHDGREMLFGSQSEPEASARATLADASGSDDDKSKIKATARSINDCTHPP